MEIFPEKCLVPIIETPFSFPAKKQYVVLDNRLISNASITLSSFQNIVINQKLIYVNVNYDHARNTSDYVYLNSSVAETELNLYAI